MAIAFNQLSTGFRSVLSKKFSPEDYLRLDLSENNKELKQIDITSANAFEEYINKLLRQHDKKVAYGGYLEKRSLYRRSPYFTNTQKLREIHLGVDFWAPSGTKVTAPLDGKIFGLANNTNFGDYGATIILKHCLNGETFYTLYGHLDMQSLQNNRVGDDIEEGQAFAKLGDADVNGDYAPHLHFQIIKDLEGNTTDYPGVCAQNEVDFYKENCPNPNLLLNIDSHL